ncbi:MAG: hypothetical protein ACJ72Z_09730 [Pyrinomonadaceae bacterium]
MQRRRKMPVDHKTNIDKFELENEGDPLFDRDWEVFVIKRDERTGEFQTQTICCDEAPIS